MDSRFQSQMQNPNYLDETDEELLNDCDRGDHQAFGELARRYRDLAFRVAFYSLRDEQEAHDQVQNAFCKAYQGLPRFRRDAKFSTWLMRIVTNECLMQLRSAKRVRLVSLDELRSRGGDRTQFHDGRRSAQMMLENAEATEIIRREIRRIPPLFRRVFLLRDVEHRPMADVAETLGISLNAAKIRLLRARTELRNRLERQRCKPGRNGF